ncbi:MAG: reverse transcriptase domain-containing protein, partial [Myxococcota bacterium]
MTPIPASFSETQREFAKRIFQEKRVDIEREFKGMGPEAAKAKVQSLAARFNRSNPWAGSSATRDKLRSQAGWWKAIGADNTVLSWILCGARLPMVEEPIPPDFPNHPSYDEHEAFAEKEIAAAVAEGTFRPISAQEARIVNPISIEPNKAGTKLRMCVDARWHNAHLPRIRFKLETIEGNLSDVVRQHDAMLTTDISRAYYSVPIVEEATPYLAVRHRGQLFAPTVLPFGSSLAPFIFNKITRTVVRFARFVGVRVLNFYDDFLWAAESAKAHALAAWVRWFLPASGWVLNAKCRWDPAHLQEFLGFDVDAKAYTVHVTKERIERAVQTLASMVGKADVSMRPLEQLIGQISSMRAAVTPVQLWTRELYRSLAGAKDANENAKTVRLSAGAVKEIQFWAEQLRL